MKDEENKPRKRSKPAEPTSDNPKVPPASETWVEGQPTSDADYGGDEKASE